MGLPDFFEVLIKCPYFFTQNKKCTYFVLLDTLIGFTIIEYCVDRKICLFLAKMYLLI